MNETPASFSFTILSPVWQRWWFLALAAMMVGLAGHTVYRYRGTHLVGSMSDIVRAINPRRDRRGDLAKRMREFAGDVFTAREIEFSFRAPAGASEYKLAIRGQRQIGEST